MVQIFGHIPHTQRKVFQRTTMKDIFLFFLYEPVLLHQKAAKIKDYLKQFRIETTGNAEDSSLEDNNRVALMYSDSGVSVNVLANGILVNVPAKDYRDFTLTSPVWEHIESILKIMGATPTSWAFLKTNRFQFVQTIKEKDKESVLKLVLSPSMLNELGGNNVFAEESNDKNRFFSFQYQFEQDNGKDTLSLKYMIATRNYISDNLCRQVLETNEMMFDGWHWSMSPAILEFLDKPKSDKQ